MKKPARLSTQEIAYCAIFTALMAVGAWIKIVIPVGVFTVTISLQVFFAVAAGIILGARRGFLSVFVYLLIGLLGVPVFAHGGGIFYVIKPTFGFLIGFALAAFLSGTVFGALKEKMSMKTAALLAALAGEAGYYVCGLVYYGIMYNYFLGNTEMIGLKELLYVWCFSTIVPDTIICLLAGAFAVRLLPISQKMMKRV